MNKNISDLTCDLTYRITKAKALCTEVVTQYCESASVDPDSEDERARLSAYSLCKHYPTWSILLHCAWDMLIDAEKLAWQLVDILDAVELEEKAGK